MDNTGNKVAPSTGKSQNPGPEDYQYPFAAAPDIIRANQKDIYFQGVLFENISTVLRRLYGARFLHKYTSETRTVADLLYLGCTTLLGNRTLGEEYCDIVQIENDTRKLPAISRRAAYILFSVVLPYLLERTLPGLRSRIRLRLEARVSGGQPERTSRKIESYILENLQTLTSTAPTYALGLSIFYFSGAYYHISKRVAGLRYIFTKRIEPSDQRVGYEVLGVLLILQMVVQGWIHIKDTWENSSIAKNEEEIKESSLDTSKRIKDSIETHTNTPVSSEPSYSLSDDKVLGWIEGYQQRKCTLCLEELKDPSATTCGHVFCWTCIADWIREKPECPLCRQSVMSQHVLPLRE